MSTQSRMTELRQYCKEVSEGLPGLQNEDDRFLLWYMLSDLTDDKQAALKALAGGKGDKQIDAVLIDKKSRSVFVIQGKSRKRLNGGSEKRAEVIGFAAMTGVLCQFDTAQFNEYVEDMELRTAELLREARERIHNEAYDLQMIFVTPCKCSHQLAKDAEETFARSLGDIAGRAIPRSFRYKIGAFSRAIWSGICGRRSVA